MNTKQKFSVALALFALALIALAPPVAAQTATPNTTLTAAQSATQTFICLNSTTSLVNQSGIYVDNEYELILLSNTQVIPAGPTCQIPVSRSNRTGVGAPTAHSNGAIAWVQLTPSASLIPAVTGFSYDTSFKAVGPCTRGAQVYLPVILVDLAMKRDCANLGTSPGMWVDYAPEAGLDLPSQTPVQLEGTNGALSISSGSYIINKAGVLALTLGAPTAGVQDGMVIKLESATANAHTLTATSLLNNGGTGVPYTTATFAAHAGAYIVLRSYNALWYVIAVSNVTLS